MLLTSIWVLDLMILFGISILFAYLYSTRKYDYFKKRNVHYERPIPLFGSIFPVISMKITIGEWLRQLYNSTNAPYFGIFVFDEPYIIIKSPEIIKNILVKDFNKFTDRTILAPKHNDILSNMLFLQKNPDWKKVRAKMSPVFSSGKLKGMLSIINEVGVDLNRYIRKNLGQLEAKEVTAKYSTDVIAKCAFAINSYSFEDENSEFRKVGRAFFDFTWRNGLVQSIYFFKHNLANTLRLDFIEQWALNFLRDIFWNAIEKRQQTKIKGNDLIDIIVEMRNNKELCEELNFDGDKVVAQAVQFFAAGFETTSSAISYTLYEICLQPKIQTKLRKEIISSIKKHDGITNEGLKEMKYMDMCIFETLRKYPVLPFLDRRCNENYKIPGTGLTIEKGMPVYIPLMALHYDEKYFPEPEKYDPERFSENNTHNTNGLYYMPFGEGPRVCIGERFGMLGVKVGLSHILSEFVVERAPETPVPVKFEPKSFLLQSTVGLPLRFRELQPTAA
nr:cytochrome P450 [Pharsalia antennata]